jgi:hypothetical protein
MRTTVRNAEPDSDWQSVQFKSKPLQAQSGFVLNTTTVASSRLPSFT